MRVLSSGLILCLGGLAIAADPAPTSAPPPTPKKYFTHTVGPVAVGRSVAGAAIEQRSNIPHEWGQGMAGFGKRFASAFGHHILKKGIEYPIARLHHEPFSYTPSGKTTVKGRLIYAVTAVAITHKTTDGSKTVHAGELSGAIGSGLLSRLWQPASTRTLASGFGSAGTTLALDAASNVIREFWPEIRHPHSHRTAAAKPVAAVRRRDDEYVVNELDREEELR